MRGVDDERRRMNVRPHAAMRSIVLLALSCCAPADAAAVEFMGYYGCEPSTQQNHTNLCITSSPSTLVEGAAAGMAGMAQVTWAFFENARPPRAPGLQLRPDYAAGWATARATCGPGSHDDDWSPPCSLDALRANGTTIGVFLGDELLLQGVTVAELTAAAAAVKAAWGATNTSIVYWNEAWDPVVNNASFAEKHPASALGAVPTEVDWVSLDYYRRDATAWTVPEAAYASALYPKMVRAGQRALLVPGAFGRKHDVCGGVGTHCGGNASLPPCCAGQTNHSAAWWDAWSTTVAEHYYDWAKRDARVIGINPWYYGADRPTPTCGGNNISVRQQPTARRKWADIGRAIMDPEKQSERKMGSRPMY